jgi:hypothetical protein
MAHPADKSANIGSHTGDARAPHALAVVIRSPMSIDANRHRLSKDEGEQSPPLQNAVRGIFDKVHSALPRVVKTR